MKTYPQYLKETGRHISDGEYRNHDCSFSQDDGCTVCERYFTQKIQEAYDLADCGWCELPNEDCVCDETNQLIKERKEENYV